MMVYIIAFLLVALVFLAGYRSGFSDALRRIEFAASCPALIMPHPDAYEALKKHGASITGGLAKDVLPAAASWKAAMEKLAETIRDFARDLGGTD